MDITQIIIIISLLATTTIIVIAGIYLIGILKDIKTVTGLVTTVSNLFEAVNKFIARFKTPESKEPKESREPKSTPKSFFKPKH